MSKSKIFMGVCLSFALGIFLASGNFFSGLYAYSIAGLGAALLLGGFLNTHPAGKALVWGGLCLLVLALGVLRFAQTLEENQFKNLFEQKVKWEGLVMEEPDIRSDRQMLKILPKGYTQQVLVTTVKSQDFFYGDWVVWEGKLKEPRDFNEFDYSGYLERFGVYAVAQYPKIFILKSNQGSAVKYFLLKVKTAFFGKLKKYLKEPENSLALGILIGAKRGLSPEITESFNTTGTSHIVAMSGFNIAIIVSALNILAWGVGRRANFWLSVFIIAGFVIIAGASASVIRAAVMGILLLLSFNTGRMYSVLPALLFAAALMLYLNPKILFWDIGFQLSFAATLGLIMYMPLLEKLTPRWPNVFGLKSLILATFSATLSTLPLVLGYFGRLSLVSLLANVLILPALPLAMLFGFLTILPFAAPGFGFLASLLLSYILWVAKTLSNWPLASVPVEPAFGVLLVLTLFPLAVYGLLKILAKRTVLS